MREFDNKVAFVLAPPAASDFHLRAPLVARTCG